MDIEENYISLFVKKIKDSSPSQVDGTRLLIWRVIWLHVGSNPTESTI